jgi:hypothetical protein
MSATTGTQARPAVLQATRRAGARTFFTWLGLALLAFPIAGEVGHLISGRVDGVVPALLGGALTGAGVGFAQWLMIRRTLDVGPGWIAATSIGLAVGLALGAMVVGYETTISQLAIMGAISGAFVGVAQGSLLRNKFSLWPAWMIAMPVMLAVGWVVTDVAGIDVDKQFIVFGLSGSFVFGTLSALLLVGGMRRDGSAPA